MFTDLVNMVLTRFQAMRSDGSMQFKQESSPTFATSTRLSDSGQLFWLVELSWSSDTTTG